jgi:hypothetical protein
MTGKFIPQILKQADSKPLRDAVWDNKECKKLKLSGLLWTYDPKTSELIVDTEGSTIIVPASPKDLGFDFYDRKRSVVYKLG